MSEFSLNFSKILDGVASSDESSVIFYRKALGKELGRVFRRFKNYFEVDMKRFRNKNSPAFILENQPNVATAKNIND